MADTIPKRRLRRYLVADEVCKALRAAIAEGRYGGLALEPWAVAIDLLIDHWKPLAGKQAYDRPRRPRRRRREG